jgi:hypothetical protein
VDSSYQPVTIISKIAKGVITFKAEQPSNDAGRVIVIDVQRNVGTRWLFADRATTLLGLEHLLVLPKSHAILPLEMQSPVGKL